MSTSNITVNGTMKDSRRIECRGALDPETQCSVVESVSAIRETKYPRDYDIPYLLGLFRNQGTTGTLRIDISQGTVNGIRFEERQKLP